MEEINRIGDRVKQAKRIRNPFSVISSSFQRHTKNNTDLILKCMKVERLDKETKDWCFTLFKNNMQDIYEKSSSGWNEMEKLSEMFDEPSAYYLIAYENSRPVGFSHFRFDMDFDSQVVYCYELQIDSTFRRNGLGKHIMDILEALCVEFSLEKVILTCSKYNENGMKFFKEHLKYKRDETDLNEEDPSLDYEILSKTFQ